MKSLKNQNGVALLTALMVMSLLTIIGISASNTTNIELKIAGNEKVSFQAFYVAEAGVYAGIAELRGVLKNDASINWDDIYTSTPSSLFTDEPLGNGTYSVTVQDNSAVVPDTILLTSTGTLQNSTKNIDATLKREEDSDINFGAFGDKSLVIHNSGSVRSYTSDEVLSPTKTDTDDDGTYDVETLEGDVGSNEAVTLYTDSYVGGEVALGETVDGDDATLVTKSGTIVLGENSYTIDEDGNLILTGVDVSRVDADSLFTDGGEIAQAMIYDTDDTSGITFETLSLPTTLTSGDHYYEDISLSGTLTIENGSMDAINLFIYGDLILGNSAVIDIKTKIIPTKLEISGSPVLKANIGTPYLVDENDNHVQEQDSEFVVIDEDGAVVTDEGGEPVLAVGNVVGMLADTSGAPILDDDGDKILVDGVFYLVDKGTSVFDGYVYCEKQVNSGNVNIFMTGTIEAKNGSAINNHLYVDDGTDIKDVVDIDAQLVPGLTTTFSIFSSSTSTTSSMDFKNSSSLTGLVYAPYTTVLIHNSADVFGSIVGKEVDIRNSGDLWFDTSLKDKYTGLSDIINILSWREY